MQHSQRRHRRADRRRLKKGIRRHCRAADLADAKTSSPFQFAVVDHGDTDAWHAQRCHTVAQCRCSIIYGAFVEIEPGIEGLVHVSEMDWTNKNVAPSKTVSLGEEVEVMVLEIDEDKRRISLGMKQCKPNPWEEFSATVQRGD